MNTVLDINVAWSDPVYGSYPEDKLENIVFPKNRSKAVHPAVALQYADGDTIKAGWPMYKNMRRRGTKVEYRIAYREARKILKQGGDVNSVVMSPDPLVRIVQKAAVKSLLLKSA